VYSIGKGKTGMYARNKFLPPGFMIGGKKPPPGGLFCQLLPPGKVIPPTPLLGLFIGSG
jgi:hypothetical protein